MIDAPRIVVVGGGLSGIAAALRIAREAPHIDLVLLEAGPQLGGVLDTAERDGCLVERGPDMFTIKAPWALELCRETGYEDQLIQARPEHRRAFLVHKGRLTPVPEGLALLKPVKLAKMVFSPLLSLRGKLRLLAERWVPARQDQRDESLASFARRRLGREVYERIVQPLIGGIYTADPEQLSMLATMPQFLDMERTHGSLIRAARRDSDASDQLASGARYDQFVTPKHGFRHFVDHLAGLLPAGVVQTEAAVQSACRDADGWQLTLANGSSMACDALLIATPAHIASKIIQDQDHELAAQLADIPYASSSVVVAACRRAQLERTDGFGLVAPLIEQRKVLAVSLSSVKFAGRAPEDQVLLRSFVGGAVQPELNALDDQQLRRLVLEELRDLLGLDGEPLWTEVVRWREAMPQYHLGHVDRVARIKQLADQHPGLTLAGAAYRGVGIPFCVRSGPRCRRPRDRVSCRF